MAERRRQRSAVGGEGGRGGVLFWSVQSFFFFQAEDGIRDVAVTGVQTCALPISRPVQARDPANRSDLGVISRLYVSRDSLSNNTATGAPAQVGLAPGGGLVRLDNLVQIVRAPTASRIDRTDRQREVRLRASVTPGFGQADRIDAVKREVAAMNLPPAYSTFVTGKAKEMEKTFTEFLWVFVLSFAFMYMILASQFESLIHPLTILLSLPLSVPFAMLSLWYTGNTLNLYSALGILVLFGVVKKNAILQIDHMNSLRAHGMERLAAIMQGNRDRLRPILMTTLALVAGMLPLWVGTGPGAGERRAIAVVVIGGQTLSLLLTLLVTPVAYSLFEDAAAALKWARQSLVPWKRGARQRERPAWAPRPRPRPRPAAPPISGGSAERDRPAPAPTPPPSISPVVTR